MNAIEPQSIDKTESYVMLKQYINTFKGITQSKTLRTLGNYTDLKDQMSDDKTGISLEDLLDLAGIFYFFHSES